MEKAERRHDAIVIGAGLAGLSCAHLLAREGRDVRVLEAAAEVGGSLKSSSLQGATIDLGPQTIQSRDPELFAHLDEIGLTSQLRIAGGNGSKRFIVLKGRLVELPSSPLSALTTRALSWPAKLRVLGEPFARPGPGGDESAADFIARRLGREVAENLLDPFVSGVHAGDPGTLSMRAAFPKLLDAERVHGSITRWALAEGRAARKARRAAGENTPPRLPSRLFSFERGLQSWAHALAHDLGASRVAVSTPAQSITSLEGGGWRVQTAERALEADHVVLALPASPCADLIEPISSGGARVLRDVPYSPVATVQLLYRRHAVAHPLDGFGLLIPTREHRPVLGILWISSLFADRAPEGTVLTTSFIGGARAPEHVQRSDDQLIEMAHEQHRELLTTSEAPIAAQVQRWHHAIPRVEFGHVDRLATLARTEQLHHGLHFAGSYGEGGAALPMCWKRGRDVARKIIAAGSADPARAWGLTV